MQRALLIASNEICYNPRLLKTADSLIERGLDVSVFNPVVGLADPALYGEIVRSRVWEVHGFDISKRTPASWVAWALSSAVSRACGLGWRTLGTRAGFDLVRNRGLVGFPWAARRFDVLVVNLVDNLPLAARLKRRHGSSLIYDSQELFSSEAETLADPNRLQWVHEAERRFIKDADVVMTTTQALADRLTTQFRLSRPAIRVRNAPLRADGLASTAPAPGIGEPLKLVWHGFGVHYQGRGVDVLLDAIAGCSAPVQLTLQGRLNEDQRRVISAATDRLGIASRVRCVPPAHPERIVASLASYDVGVIAETGKDENQALTSSNKLFDYIHAGLAVIAPNLPGLSETMTAEAVGLLYAAGDSRDLANAIDRLATCRQELAEYRRRAQLAAPGITWGADFDAVWQIIQPRLGDLASTDRAVTMTASSAPQSRA